MMKTNKMEYVNLDSILFDFRNEAADAPNPAVLDTYCSKYPQYAKELTEFALQWLLDEAVDSVSTDDVDKQVSSVLISRAISRFHDGVSNRVTSSETMCDTGQANPFEAMTIKRKREIRDRLGIDLPLLAKFQNRLIDPESTPNRFLVRLAEELGQNVEATLKFLQKPPKLHSQGNYKSRDKPCVSKHKESFEHAVIKSSLDDLQKQELLKD